MVTKLFTLTFTDDSQLWATIQNGSIAYGIMRKGINVLIKPVFEKVPTNEICFFAEHYANNSIYVKHFTDHVEENSLKIKTQLA